MKMVTESFDKTSETLNIRPGLIPIADTTNWFKMFLKYMVHETTEFYMAIHNIGSIKKIGSGTTVP
jgi:hypothetical protein